MHQSAKEADRIADPTRAKTMPTRFTNEKELVKLLEGIQSHPEALELFRVQPVDPSVRAGMRLWELGRPIEAELEKAWPYAGGQPMFSTGNGYIGFLPQFAVRHLMRRVLSGMSPSDAVHELERILLTTDGTTFRVMALRGVSATKAIQFSNGVRLVPFDELPAGRTKDYLTTKSGHIGPPVGVVEPPQVALVHPPVNRRVGFVGIDPDSLPKVADDPFIDVNLLDDCRLALTLFGPSCPMNAGSWEQFSDPLLDEVVGGGGTSFPLDEVVPPWHQEAVSLSDDDEDVARVVNKFCALPSTDYKERLRLALDRLNRAVRRAHGRDGALDLSIALEIMLADGQGENTYKIGLRSALVLGGDSSTRLKNRSVVGSLYVARSSLVHTGKLPEKLKYLNSKISATDLMVLARDVVAAVLKAMIDKGATPDWYVLELH